MISIMETESAHPEVELSPDEEKRKSPRVAVDNFALLTVLESNPQRIYVRIVDASKEGLKLLAACRLLPGSTVQVYVRDLFILAEVRYCRAAGDLYCAGVQIKDVFPASG